MTKNARVMIAVAIVLTDLVVFIAPLAAFVAAFVVLARPTWAKEFFSELYRDC